MRKRTKAKETVEYYDIRVRVPKILGQNFADEAKKEHRKLGEQLTVIFEERYTSIEF